MRDSQDKPDVVKDIILGGHVDRKIFTYNNNNDDKEGNGTLMSNIREIKGTRNIMILQLNVGWLKICWTTAGRKRKMSKTKINKTQTANI